MNRRSPRIQVALHRVFLVTLLTAAILGLLAIWGLLPDGSAGVFVTRLIGSCVVIAVAAAFIMSANRLVDGRAPEDDRE